jgi:tRNA threonylcarbamoyladenosine biosynthesis protein TsaE
MPICENPNSDARALIKATSAIDCSSVNFRVIGVTVDTLSLSLQDEAATAALAQRLASAVAQARFSVHLNGDLGTGKTTFTRYLLKAWGVKGRIRSPTYALVEEYGLPDGRTAFHLDLYRFGSADEWLDAGLDELDNKSALLIVEWAERAQQLIAPPDLSCHFTAQSADSREARLTALTPAGRAALSNL